MPFVPSPARSHLVLASSVTALLAFAGCQQKAAFQPPPPPPVTVAVPLVQPVQDAAEFNGQAFASRSVDLVARVPGFLSAISFADGDDVGVGETLFTIEQDQYQAQVALAQATVEQHQATLKSLEAEFQRQAQLQKQAISTEANYDKALANRDAERAAVSEAQANLQIAQINLAYTKVAAPFSGRVGRRLVDVGNLVGSGGATKLATISDLSQVYVYFTVNERDLLRIRASMAEKGVTREAVKGTPVFGTLAGDAGTRLEGRLDFVDSGLDATTGTMQLRAVFDNPKRILLPGLYVRLRIPDGPPKPALLVPEASVAFDQVGPYLLVSEKDGVAIRRVKPGPVQNGLRVISEGILQGDKVVIDGLQNATPGRPVTLVDGVIAPAGAAAKS
jgi:membrane fusion protein, multidrug efflux system